MFNLILSLIISSSLYSVNFPVESVEIIENIPILMYHEIGEPDGPWENLYVSQDNFRNQVEHLKNNGYNTITMEDLEKNRTGKKRLPKKPIIITFDDGYSSMYNFVFPLLKENNMKGVFYVYPKKFGTWNSLTKEEIKEMSDNNMEIGSHSLSHFDMGSMNRSNIIFELEESKKILEEITEKNVVTFCYPAGRYSQVVIEELINSNYKNAVTTKYGFYSSSESAFEIKRVRINYSDSIDGFIKKIAN